MIASWLARNVSKKASKIGEMADGGDEYLQAKQFEKKMAKIQPESSGSDRKSNPESCGHGSKDDEEIRKTSKR